MKNVINTTIAAAKESCGAQRAEQTRKQLTVTADGNTDIDLLPIAHGN